MLSVYAYLYYLNIFLSLCFVQPLRSSLLTCSLVVSNNMQTVGVVLFAFGVLWSDNGYEIFYS